MKKLVFFHLFNDRSGSPKVLSQVIGATLKDGSSADIVTSESSSGFLNGFQAIYNYSFYKRSENKLITLFYYLVSQISVFRSCLKYRKDTGNIIFYVNTMMPFAAAVAGKLFGISVIYHIHEISVNPPLLKRFLRYVIKKTASKVIFVSNFLKNSESFRDIPQYVVHNAIECTSHNPEVLRDESSFNVLMISSMKKYKGIFEFFKLAEMPVFESKNIKFTIVLNADKNEISGYFKDYTIPKNIEVISRQTDVEQFYRKANVVLNLSRPDECVETFGLTLLEAMAHGIPVIAPPVGGPAEIVTNGVNGYTISSYDTQEIADTIIELSSNAGLYNRLSKNAKLRAQDFSIENFEKNILNVINS